MDTKKVGKAIADIAWDSFCARLWALGVRPERVDDNWRKMLVDRIEATLNEAAKDAQAAQALGMADVAEQMFVACISTAGVQAADQVAAALGAEKAVQA